jgi:hypothetical protein
MLLDMFEKVKIDIFNSPTGRIFAATGEEEIILACVTLAEVDH